jgi:hypothetical protein
MRFSVNSCSACSSIVLRRHGYKPGDTVRGINGLGVVEGIIHPHGKISVIVDLGATTIVCPPDVLTPDKNSTAARQVASWALVGDER